MTVNMNSWSRRQFIKLSTAAVFQMMFASCASLAESSTNNQTQTDRMNRLQASPQYKDGEFVNPIDAPVMAEGSTWNYIKKSYFTERLDPEPNGELPVKAVVRNDWTNMDREKFFFAWLGHSSVLIAMEGKIILVDPVMENRASPFTWVGPKRFHPAPVTAKGLPPIDVVVITHDHYDHLEEPTIKQLDSKTGLFLVPLGIGELIEEWGIAPEKVVELDWWEHHKIGTLNFTATPAIHYARRGVFDGNERLWCSWAVQGPNKRFFISGDSGYFDGFKKIGEELGPFEVTFLKVGSYDDMWKQIHMLPEEAVQQHQDLDGDIMVPLHWATFDLGLHPWYEPIERTLTAARKTDVQVITPIIGEQVNTNQLPKNNSWWRNIDEHQE
jgi:L-ascorbate metabolism protein UlaG (beta-lactamase superfamily)